jgi:hypothetical protein
VHHLVDQAARVGFELLVGEPAGQDLGQPQFVLIGQELGDLAPEGLAK